MAFQSIPDNAPVAQCHSGVEALIAPAHEPAHKKSKPKAGHVPPPPHPPVIWGKEVYVPAFTLAATDLRDGKGLEAAEASGWRVFTPYAGDSAVLSIMTAATPTQASEVAAIQQQDRAKAAFDAMVRITNMKEVDQCQLKWLSIPSILFEGFWLDSQTPNQPDLISPVFTVDTFDPTAGADSPADPAPQSQTDQATVWHADDFLAIAREYAKIRLDPQYCDLPVTQAQQQNA